MDSFGQEKIRFSSKNWHEKNVEKGSIVSSMSSDPFIFRNECVTPSRDHV